MIPHHIKQKFECEMNVNRRTHYNSSLGSCPQVSVVLKAFLARHLTLIVFLDFVDHHTAHSHAGVKLCFMGFGFHANSELRTPCA